MADEVDPRKVELWEAVNGYAAACKGDTSNKTVSVRRMKAVVAVERAAFFDPSPVGAGWLKARGAEQDPEHPDEWLLPWCERDGGNETLRLVVDIGFHPGVSYEGVWKGGRTVDCVTLVYGGLTVGRLEALCFALEVPLEEKS